MAWRDRRKTWKLPCSKWHWERRNILTSPSLVASVKSTQMQESANLARTATTRRHADLNAGRQAAWYSQPSYDQDRGRGTSGRCSPTVLLRSISAAAGPNKQSGHSWRTHSRMAPDLAPT